MINFKNLITAAIFLSLFYENAAFSMDNSERVDGERARVSQTSPAAPGGSPAEIKEEEKHSAAVAVSNRKTCSSKFWRCWEKTREQGCSKACCQRLGKNTCIETSRFFMCLYNFFRCRGWQWRQENVPAPRPKEE